MVHGDDCGAVGGMNGWKGKPKYSEKTCPSATLSSTNPTWLDPDLKPGHRGGKSLTNLPSYGTVFLKCRTLDRYIWEPWVWGRASVLILRSSICHFTAECMKMYRSMIYSLQHYISGGDWLASCPGCFIPGGGGTQFPLYMSVGGLCSSSGGHGEMNILDPTGTWPLSPLASSP
jgi:hypothetical protein